MTKSGEGRRGDARRRAQMPVRHRGTSVRRRGPLVLAVAVGLVAGAGSAFGAAQVPGAGAFFGPPASASASTAAGTTTGTTSGTATGTADAAATPDGSVLDRDGASSRSGAVRPFDPPIDVPFQIDAVPTVSALPPGLTAADVAAGLLSADVPEVGTGTFVVVPGSDPGPGTGTVRTVRVEVEAGLALDGAAFAATVMATLNDPRSWGGDGSMSFARTDGDAELRVLLASPETVDALCAPLRTDGEVSCGRAGHAALNLRRWVEATPEYAADKVLYRQYLVNHEVGHLLGHQHEKCPGAGQPAPVMQQQSYQVAPCVPNAWPFP